MCPEGLCLQAGALHTCAAVQSLEAALVNLHARSLQVQCFMAAYTLLWRVELYYRPIFV